MSPPQYLLSSPTSHLYDLTPLISEQCAEALEPQHAAELRSCLAAVDLLEREGFGRVLDALANLTTLDSAQTRALLVRGTLGQGAALLSTSLYNFRYCL